MKGRSSSLVETVIGFRVLGLQGLGLEAFQGLGYLKATFIEDRGCSVDTPRHLHLRPQESPVRRESKKGLGVWV